VLKPYQREAVDLLYSYRQRGGGEGLIVIPTGGGKSLVVAHAFRLPRQDAARLMAATPNIEWRPAPHPCEAMAMSADARSACGAGPVDAGTRSSDGGTDRPSLAETDLRWRWAAGPPPSEQRPGRPDPRETV
jgi:hypothetical protein